MPNTERDRARLLDTSHADAAKTFQRLQRVAERGGSLWIYEPAEDRCHAITVTPQAGDKVAMREAYTARKGGAWSLSRAA